MATPRQPLNQHHGQPHAPVRGVRSLRRRAWPPALLLIAATTAAPAAVSPQVAAPAVTGIRVAHDTVSFFAQTSPHGASEWRVARFAVRSRAWESGDRVVRAVPVTIPERAGDVVRLARGLTLTSQHRSPLHGEFFDYFVVGGQPVNRYPLRAAMPPLQRWRLLLSRDSAAILWRYDPPPICTSPGSWVVDAKAIWFGCAEGGSLSGVLRFDRATHHTTMVTAPGVVSTSIVGVARTRRAVWVAGRADATSGLVDSGLFRFDVAGGTWSRLERAPTAIAATGDTL